MLTVFLLLFGVAAFSQTRQMAITFDDLPRGGDTGSSDGVEVLTRKLLGRLRGVPVAGFVNGGRLMPELGERRRTEVLRMWCQAGAVLGNHTYSHPDLSRTPASEYIDDIAKGEPAIEEACGHKPAYFRHPFLRTGKDAATREAVDRYLVERRYRVAPVTIDNSDWLFAAVYTRALREDRRLAERVRTAYLEYTESVTDFYEKLAVEVVGRPIDHVLLLHVNQLNADVMPELLQNMKRRGFAFVSLDGVLEDGAYRIADNYIGPAGISWIHRWAASKGMRMRDEPDPPNWVQQLYRKGR